MQQTNTNPRHQAVLLRESGLTATEVAKTVGLSAPTVLSLHKAFKTGGWVAVDQRTPGRPRTPAHQGAPSDTAQQFAHDSTTLWTTELLAQWLSQRENKPINARAAQRRMAQWGWLPPPHTLRSALTAGAHTTPTKDLQLLWARTPRGELVWVNLPHPPTDSDYCALVQHLLARHPDGFSLALSFAGLQYTPQLTQWLAAHPQVKLLPHLKPTAPGSHTTQGKAMNQTAKAPAPSSNAVQHLTHLQRLEAESIHIMREVVATCDNPVMLYSIGKDSAVMLHLALKAFYPAKLPFPLLHVDTGWKFKDMYAFRNRMQAEHDFKLLVHQNPDGIAMGINPFTHGSQIHTDIMKTQGLKQALDHHQFDAAFGGARRDEEKSRAKERIFSFRSAQHRWDPKNQRPELWNLYNTHKNKGESLRVFPISNWTELDIWQYIHLEGIPIVPLYFSQERPVVERDGSLIMVDDERMPLQPGEVPMLKKVRFRTLGCYPLTGAVESEADTLPTIIQEMLLTKTSERQGRVIDHDAAASMEKKKQEGYF
jgi:sulfate adenylyltransferase subunit 2